MATKFRIAVLGIGGVGGYIGAKLALFYSDSDAVEIVFIARGENERVIKANGLKLITESGEVIARPAIVTSKPEEIGVVDLLICCVKGYDLEASIQSSKSCISDKTVILPLLNGVDATEKIKAVLPQAEVWDGCVYMVSKLAASGVVEEKGNINSLFFGSAQAESEKLQSVEGIFKSAGINAHLSKNILQTVWEKFIFISPLATLTSYLNLNFGEINRSDDYKALLFQLVNELKLVADAKNIPLPENSVQKTMDKFNKLLPDTTSSMQRDFQRRSKTELDSLTGYVVRAGKEFNIPTPVYAKMFNELKDRAGA